MTSLSEHARPRIDILATPKCSPSVLFGLLDVLGSVGAMYPEMTTGMPGEERLEIRVVAADPAPFRCCGDILVEPDGGLDDNTPPDAILVCDLYMPVDRPPRGTGAAEIAWLRRQHAAGVPITSVCTGSLLLAEAGLLDGRDAAVHWAYRDLFRREYPDVRLCPETMLCLSSEPEGVVTAGGVSAWHDLAIYLIARFCGHRAAVETAKVFLISGHSEGQLPYAVMTRQARAADGVIADCQEWIAGHYAVDAPVERMVARSGLSPRTFARRFRAATGFAPIDYVQALRIEEAKQMLETEDTGIDGIAMSVGYADPASFRRLFKRLSGLTPAQYRRKFGPRPLPRPGLTGRGAVEHG